jgi:hypothetical protein
MCRHNPKVNLEIRYFRNAFLAIFTPHSSLDTYIADKNVLLQSWTNRTSDICLEGLRKHTKTLSQNSLSSGLRY